MWRWSVDVGCGDGCGVWRWDVHVEYVGGVWRWGVEVECGSGVWRWGVEVECGAGVWRWSVEMECGARNMCFLFLHFFAYSLSFNTADFNLVLVSMAT